MGFLPQIELDIAQTINNFYSLRKMDSQSAKSTGFPDIFMACIAV